MARGPALGILGPFTGAAVGLVALVGTGAVITPPTQAAGSGEIEQVQPQPSPQPLVLLATGDVKPADRRKPYRESLSGRCKITIPSVEISGAGSFRLWGSGKVSSTTPSAVSFGSFRLWGGANAVSRTQASGSGEWEDVEALVVALIFALDEAA